MSQKINLEPAPLNQLEQENQPTPAPKPLTGAAKEVADDKKEEIAAQNAAGVVADLVKSPEETAKSEATATGETEELRIAKAIAAVRALNPDMSLEDVAKLVISVFKKTETVEGKVAKEVSTIIAPIENEYKEKIYLKKDTKRKFPLEKEALNGIVVRQTYKRKDEEDNEIEVPAKNLNEIAIYSKEDFERLNHGDPKKPGFAREGITVEVWHKPGQTNTVQD